MKKIISYSLFILLPLTCYSQLFKQWDYRYGGSGDDLMLYLQQTFDGGFLVEGYSNSDSSFDKTQNNWDITLATSDYWIVKIDSNGVKQWDKRYGGINGDHHSYMCHTVDSGYVIAGSSISNNSGDKTDTCRGSNDYWIVRTDANGNKLWDKTFGGIGNDLLESIVQTRDKGFLLGGTSSSSSSGDKSDTLRGVSDYWIVKTDSNGIKQWDKCFGGLLDEFFISAQQNFDGGYILGGTSSSGIGGDKSVANWGMRDYWIVKIDSTGTKLWDKVYGGTDDEILGSIIESSDNGFIIAGTSYSGISGDKTQNVVGGSDYWIIKTDSSGIIQWDKDFGGSSADQLVSTVTQTFDGGYLLPGASYSNAGGDKTENNLAVRQAWVVKTDAQGNKQWDKTLRVPGLSWAGQAIETKDGCYLMGCPTDGFGGDKTQQSWNNSEDYWILKYCNCNIAVVPFIIQNADTLFVQQNFATYQWYHDSIMLNGATNYFYVASVSGNYNVIVTDSNGCGTGAGILNVVAGVNNFQGNMQITISPNPSNEFFFISSSQTITQLKIFNTLGVLQSTIRNPQSNASTSLSKTFEINISSLASGIYFVHVQTEKGSVVRKVVVSY
jgi:hypothetical protein